MASTSRQSAYSLSSERIPDWLSEPPLSFGEFLRPPSYLIASLQQAFDDISYGQDPPTYDNSVGPSRLSSPRPVSAACGSIWEDDDEETNGVSSDGADDEDDGEVEDGDRGTIGSEAVERSGDEQALPPESPPRNLSTPISSNSGSSGQSQLTPPTPPPKDPRFNVRPLSPTPYIPPPAYHLLHLQHIMRTDRMEKDPYSSLATCLAALDPELLLKPFAVFADVCYEASVKGDTSPSPLRPFSPPPRLTVIPSSSTAQAVEDDDETTDDEAMPTSPAQTFASLGVVPPLIWDPRFEDHIRTRSELPIRMPRSLSPMSPFMSQEALSSPISETSLPGRARTVKFAPHPDPLMEVASLFLHTPVPVSAQESVHGFPTRPDKAASKRSRSRSRSGDGKSTVKGLLLRSLNINQPRWVAV